MKHYLSNKREINKPNYVFAEDKDGKTLKKRLYSHDLEQSVNLDCFDVYGFGDNGNEVYLCGYGYIYLQ